MLDHQLADGPQLDRVIGQGFEGLRHGREYTAMGNRPEPKIAKKPMFYWANGYPAVSGFQVLKGARQSIPSSSIAS